MTVGDKIKKIRTFRGMTQKELGLAIGFEEKGADNRIAQYETNYRVPKRELLDKMAEALRVDRQNFYTIAPGSAEDFMRTFFWLDEDSLALSACSNLSAIRAEQGPLMIPLYGTMIAMTGPHTLPWYVLPVWPCGRVHAGMAFSSAGVTRRGDHQGRVF